MESIRKKPDELEKEGSDVDIPEVDEVEVGEEDLANNPKEPTIEEPTKIKFMSCKLE